MLVEYEIANNMHKRLYLFHSWKVSSDLEIKSNIQIFCAYSLSILSESTVSTGRLPAPIKKGWAAGKRYIANINKLNNAGKNSEVFL